MAYMPPQPTAPVAPPPSPPNATLTAPIGPQPTAPAGTDPTAAYAAAADAAMGKASQALTDWQSTPPPTMQNATYKPPNKTGSIIAGVLSLLFPGAPIAAAASGYLGGSQRGAQQRYQRQEGEAQQDYNARMAAYQQKGEQARTAVTAADAQAGIAQRATAAAASVQERADAAKAQAQYHQDALRLRANEDSQRFRQNAQKIALEAKKIANDAGFKRANLARLTVHDTEMYQTAMARNAITEEDAARATAMRYKVAVLQETGRDSRYLGTQSLAQARSQASAINAGLNGMIRQITARQDLTDEQKQQLIGQRIDQASTGIDGIYTAVSAKHPELGGAAMLGAPSMESGETYDGEPLDGSYRPPAGAGGGDTAAIVDAAVRAALGGAAGALGQGGVPGGTPGGSPGGGAPAWEATPIPGHGGAAGSPGGAQAHPAGAPPQQSQQPQVGHGPGVAPEALKANIEAVSQHASSFPTEQAVIQALSSAPGAQALSAPQVQQILETWRKTRAGQGHPVPPTAGGQAAPPAQHQAAAPAPNPLADRIAALRSQYPSMTPQRIEQIARQQEATAPRPGPPAPNPVQPKPADPVTFAKSVLQRFAEPNGSFPPGAVQQVVQALKASPYGLDDAAAQRAVTAALNPSVGAQQRPAAAPAPRPTTAPAGTDRPQHPLPHIKPPAPLAPPGTRTGANVPGVDPRAERAIQAAAGAATYGAAVQAVARATNVDPALLEAVVGGESSGNNSAVSSVGALGLGQLMPETAAGMGIDPHDPIQNLAGAAVYLRAQLERFHSVPRALASYNAGPEAVARSRTLIPNIPETQEYVRRVMAAYIARKKQLAQQGSGQ